MQKNNTYSSESAIMRAIQLAASTQGHRLFRNNTGLFYTKVGTPVRCGLCVGSSDLVGYTSTGRFLAVEVKTTPGRLSNDQRAFLMAVVAAGGIGICARSVDDFFCHLSRFLSNNS